MTSKQDIEIFLMPVIDLVRNAPKKCPKWARQDSNLRPSDYEKFGLTVHCVFFIQPI
jgi:hypothetical protein